MSDSYQRVEPTPFDAAPQAAAPAQARSTEGRPAWLLPALAVLGLLVVIVVFLLPGWVDSPSGQPPAPQADTTTGTGNSATSTRERAAPTDGSASDASPFADAVEAKARAEAQTLLAELLDVQDNIVQRGAEAWAPSAVARVAELALSGDEHYRAREFESAISQYETALEEALAIEGSLPKRFEQQMQAATTAVEALEPEPARQALSLAQRLEPGAPALAPLEQRVDALPEVITALETANSAEENNDLAAAVDSLQRAAGLDPDHERVQSELSRVKAALNQQRFNAAMSEGYAALDSGQYSRAQQRFEQAGKLQPDSSEADAALQELAVARTVATLNDLQRKGEAALADEDWETAIASFEKALAIDGSLRFAREGLALARPQAVLDKELQAILDKPERLVDDAILREARDSLRRAQAVTDAGPRLRERREAVADALAVASTPVPVSIRSDGQTEVTVYKVARLGAIGERQLSLRPGKYTAVGTRRGFRDVRVVFTVTPSGTEPVYIACSEAI